MSLAFGRLVLDAILVCFAFAIVIGEAKILSWILAEIGGVFARVAAPSEKIASLEGLRGILAFAVVLHHGCCWYFYSQTGVWSTGHNIIFERLAPFGVMQFFFLSGYLFWGKLMRKGRIDLGRFYWSRLVRIGPVYYVCAVTAILIGLSVHGFALQVPLQQLTRQLASWLFFCMGGVTSVNGADTLRIIAGITWTLALEWQFYLLLPFFGWFSRRASRLIWFILACGSVYCISKYFLPGTLGRMPHLSILPLQLEITSKFMLLGFGGGILVSVMQPKLRMINRLSARQASWALLGCYLAYLMIPRSETLLEIFLLCGFALVVQGADLFGMITTRSVRLLGIISYAVYVVHGIVYYLASRLRGGIHPVALRAYLIEALLCITVVILVSTLLHITVERPTMLLSERIARGEKQPKLIAVAAPAE